jgi:hypothetical protein
VEHVEGGLDVVVGAVEGAVYRGRVAGLGQVDEQAQGQADRGESGLGVVVEVAFQVAAFAVLGGDDAPARGPELGRPGLGGSEPVLQVGGQARVVQDDAGALGQVGQEAPAVWGEGAL